MSLIGSNSLYQIKWKSLKFKGICSFSLFPFPSFVLHSPEARPNQEQTHKDKIKNNLNNPKTNPETPTYRKNHTHFRNKFTNHKNGFGSGWERRARDWTTADGAEDGRRKSQGAQPRKFREQRSGFIVFDGSGFVVSFFVDLRPSLWSLLFLLSELVELES